MRAAVDIPPRPDAPLPVGISQCLTGEEVSYDGSGARSSMPHAALSGLFIYRTFCPEVGIGMTVPREPIRLVGTADDYRVVGVKDPTIDKTDDLVAYAEAQVGNMADLAGYIFMHNSPSCGLMRVKVYPGPDAPASRQATGIYARTVTRALPNLPAEDAGRLFDVVLRENFVTRVFTYAHWQRLRDELDAARLIAFHSRYKYLLLAHSMPAYQAAGRLLSDLKGDLEQKAEDYIAVLMSGLKQVATRKGHANVLSHLQGYLKKHLDSASRQELDQLISAYRLGEQPLLAPLALLKHHFRQFPDEYVLNQSYFEPHPTQAALRRPL